MTGVGWVQTTLQKEGAGGGVVWAIPYGKQVIYKEGVGVGPDTPSKT